MSTAEKQYENFRALAKGTNVNEVTLLATDYLNHFNEGLMLAEIVPDMPDMLDEFLNWEPKHYKDHFRDSGVADKELAIQAFDYCPEEYKGPFEAIVAKLNKQLAILQKNLANSDQDQSTGLSTEFINKKCTLIRTLIDFAGGIINGNLDSSNQDSVDEVFIEVDEVDQHSQRIAPAAKVVESSLQPSKVCEKMPASANTDANLSSEVTGDNDHEMDQSEIDALFD